MSVIELLPVCLIIALVIKGVLPIALQIGGAILVWIAIAILISSSPFNRELYQ